MTHKLGPLPDTEWLLHMPAREYEHAWTSSESGYSEDQVLAYAQAEVESAVAKERAIWAERDDIHTESSRIYAKLAVTVTGGADDATLGALLRKEVNERSTRAQRS
jgi:hypothetical protein